MHLPAVAISCHQVEEHGVCSQVLGRRGGSRASRESESISHPPVHVHIAPTPTSNANANLYVHSSSTPAKTRSKCDEKQLDENGPKRQHAANQATKNRVHVPRLLRDLTRDLVGTDRIISRRLFESDEYKQQHSHQKQFVASMMHHRLRP
eukprot:350048-Chlamydomonas_euryale.AAC.1